jgi:hypothetical protein
MSLASSTCKAASCRSTRILFHSLSRSCCWRAPTLPFPSRCSNGKSGLSPASTLFGTRSTILSLGVPRVCLRRAQPRPMKHQVSLVVVAPRLRTMSRERRTPFEIRGRLSPNGSHRCNRYSLRFQRRTAAHPCQMRPRLHRQLPAMRTGLGHRPGRVAAAQTTAPEMTHSRYG